MPVELLPPYGRGGSGPGDGEPLVSGPRFCRTRAMGRWHLPRSGVLLPETSYRPEARACYSLWCGPHVYGDTMLGRDVPPVDGLPVCGTCQGRGSGAGQHEQPYDDRELVFSPRWMQPPSTCPGHGADGAYEEINWRIGRCLVCGEFVPLRAGGPSYAGWYGMVKHEPGPGLVEPCPFHAWQYVRAGTDGSPVCRPCGRPLARKEDVRRGI